MSTTLMPDLIADAQTTEETFLHHIFVRDQMADWSKRPLVMARADGKNFTVRTKSGYFQDNQKTAKKER